MSQSVGYSDTPFLPGGQWRVHDGARPQPPVITPSSLPTEAAATPPSDAIVLFDGTNVDHWRHGDGSACKWKLVEGGAMEVVRGTGDILSRPEFGDMQLHLEFRCPLPVSGDSQGRGNSGLFLMGRYEIQILDNYENPTYADGTVGAIYGMSPPLVNPSRPPGTWQSYDVIWKAPLFDRDGRCVQPAYVTVLFNGVVVQNHTAPLGATSHRVVGAYQAHPPVGPVRLQDHGDPVQFRNLWVRPL